MLARADNIGLAFLRRVRSEHGYFAAAIKQPRKKGLRHEFASTIDELSKMIENADCDGLEVYFACWSFKEARNDPPGTPAGQGQPGRTHHNVLGVRALWLDIDAGTSKPYVDASEAWRALAEFCRTAKLPMPIGEVRPGRDRILHPRVGKGR